MKSLFTIALVLLSVSVTENTVEGHQCIHDELSALKRRYKLDSRPVPQAYHNPSRREGSRRHLEGTSTFKGVRIFLDLSRVDALELPDNGDNYEEKFACLSPGDSYVKTPTNDGARKSCSSGDVLTSTKRTILINSLNAARGYLTQALRVIPVQGNLRVDNPYSNCGGDEFNFNFACCEDQMEANPSAKEFLQNGVPNTDFLVHVTARPTSGTTLAWAVGCQRDNEQRPISAQINIGPSQIPLDGSEVEGFTRTIIHELMHGLGFSSDSWTKFWDPAEQRTISKQQVLFEGPSSELGGKPIAKVISPQVAAKTKEQFGCERWNEAGAELEDFGGSGTAGSHWEKRVFMDELMTGTKTGDSPITAVTLALFEDTGWYSVDYSLSERNIWGRNEGCDFARRTCGDSWSSNYFCHEQGEEGCTFDHLTRGSCRLTRITGNSIESHFRYFSDPELFGRRAILDYCPIQEGFSNGDCRDTESYDIWWYGDSLGTESRCFTGSWKRSIQTSDVGLHSGCLRVECDESLQVSLFFKRGSQFDGPISCPRDGGIVELSQEDLTKNSWTGTVLCPPADEICTAEFRENSAAPVCISTSCSGHGICSVINNEIQCDCDDNWAGETCSCPADDEGKVCSSRGICDEKRRECECNVGFHGDACAEEGCPVVSKDMANANCPDGESECECAGNGVCDTSKGCLCSSAFTGSACQFLACPSDENGMACGGNLTHPELSHGVCASDYGVCSCRTLNVDGTVVHFSGLACSEANTGPRQLERLHYHSANESSPTFTLHQKQYSYFTFEVESTDFASYLDVQFRWSNATLSGGELLVPSVSAYAFFGESSPTGIEKFPSMTDNVFQSASIQESSFNPTSGVGAASFTMEFSQQIYPSEYNQVGDMLISLLALEQNVDVQIQLTRDACADVECVHGTCEDGRCQCERFVFSPAKGTPQRFGWTGINCNSPDCPGNPDCGGFRGSCGLPEEGSDSSVPFCTCSTLYQGKACEQHNFDSVKYIFGAMAHEGLARDIKDASLSQDGNGTHFIRNTYTGTIDTGGDVTTEIAIDLDRLLEFNRIASVPASCHVKLVAPLNSTADPMLFLRRGSAPSLSSYDYFDASSWNARAKTHEIIARLTSGAWFIGVYNGRYGTDKLQYTLHVEIADGCPSSISGCSGHGFCSFTCTCDDGFAGSACSDYVESIDDDSNSSTKELEPGEWSFFLYTLEPADMYLEVEMFVNNDISNTFRPSLSSLFQEDKNQLATERLRSGAGEAGVAEVITDFDGIAKGRKNQSIILNRSPGSRHGNKGFLYIGIQNHGQTSRGSASLKFKSLSREEVESSCASSSENSMRCKANKCFGRGNMVSTEGEILCSCQIGWNDVNFCGAPLFESLGRMSEAAQKLSSLCSICTKTTILERNELHVFRLAKPLGPGVFHEILVESDAFSNSSGRVLEEDEAGNAALLLSTALPRSIRDYSVVKSSSSEGQILYVYNNNTASTLWVTVYGNAKGRFTVTSRRKKDDSVTLKESSFSEEVTNWAIGTSAGRTTLIGSLAFILIITGCCLVDKFGARLCPRWLRDRTEGSKLAIMFDEGCEQSQCSSPIQVFKKSDRLEVDESILATKKQIHRSDVKKPPVVRSTSIRGLQKDSELKTTASPLYNGLAATKFSSRRIFQQQDGKSEDTAQRQSGSRRNIVRKR